MSENVLRLKGYTIRSLRYENNIQGAGSLQLGASADTNIKYSDENSECMCRFSVLVDDKNNKEAFNIGLYMEAFFEYDLSADKKALHVKICEDLYGIARGIVCAFCGVAGLPPIVIPEIVFPEPETINSI